MATPFMRVQLPSTDIKAYDASVRPEQQPPSVPPTFLDAMRVRYPVYIEEQNIEPLNEVDDDDLRSVHIVAYASVPASNVGDAPQASGLASTNVEADNSMAPTVDPASPSSRPVPIATIRIVPFPHPAHHAPDRPRHSTADTDADVAVESRASPSPITTEPSSSIHDKSRESYVKLGRLAVLKDFRGYKLGRTMVAEAVAWLRANPTSFNLKIGDANMLSTGINVLDPSTAWQGLICVHAQQGLEQWWSTEAGFEREVAMGVWLEERIKHVGMWKRLDLKGGDG